MPKTEERNTNPVTGLQKSLKYGKSSAVSTYLGPNGYVRDNTHEYERVFLYPYAVNYFEVTVSEMMRSWETSYADEVRGLITDTLRQYFTQVDPLSIDIAFNAVKDIMEKSGEAYAHICTLFRVQNCTLLEDTRGINVGRLFRLKPNLEIFPFNPKHDIGPGKSEESELIDNMNITNVEWSREILQKMSYFYISPQMRNQLEFIFINTFKLQRDDGTCRFLLFVPKAQETHNEELIWGSKANFIAYMDEMRDAIKAYLTQYPFLADILTRLGLTTNSQFDFTRDLAQQSLFVYDDKYGDIEALAYAVSTGVTDDENDVDTYSSHGIVSRPTSTTLFKSNQLSIDPRIEIDVVSLANLMRKSLDTAGVTYAEFAFSTQNKTTTVEFYHMYQGQASLNVGAEGTTIERMKNVADCNMMNAILDTVGSADNYDVQSIRTDGVVTYKNVPRFGLSDYMLNVGDIDTIIAQVSYDVNFGNSTDPRIAGNRSEKLVTTNTKSVGNHEADPK